MKKKKLGCNGNFYEKPVFSKSILYVGTWNSQLVVLEFIIGTFYDFKNI